MRLYEAAKISDDVKHAQMINDIACTSLWMVLQSHVWHLQTTSYAAHKALNDFYNDIQDSADKLTELFIGAGGTFSYSNKEVKNFTSISDVISNLENFKSDLVEVEAECMKTENAPFHDLGDTVLDIIKLVDHVLYFLRMP